MGNLDREVLVSLASHVSWPSVSIYMPTHRAGIQKEQDPIRLKNLVRQAVDQLVEHDLSRQAAEELCAPVSVLLTDDTFWRDRADGMAAFLAPATAELMKLDAAVPEQLVVGDRFYLRSLMTAHRADRRFFALALSKSGSRLFSGDGVYIEEVPIEGVPASLAEELKYDQPAHTVQHSSLASGQSAAEGRRPTTAIFHGHGGEKDVDKRNLERYLRRVEQGVSRIVDREPGWPVVPFGVDYAIAMYRELNTAPSLVDHQVLGATDELAPHEIHQRALEVLEPVFAGVVNADLNELFEKEGSALASRNIDVIVTAAAEGRVRTLFFDDSLGPFGLFDRDRNTVVRLCDSRPRLLRESDQPEVPAWEDECGWDLVDLAAAETILHGGTVHALVGEDSPVRGVAAIMRY